MNNIQFQNYISDESSSTDGHLIFYPMTVGVDGEIGDIEGVECFPDTAAKIGGGKSGLPAQLAMRLTT